MVNLHQMLSRARVRARPSVLWCYKKELGFSTHRKKRMRIIKKAVARGKDTRRLGGRKLASFGLLRC